MELILCFCMFTASLCYFFFFSVIFTLATQQEWLKMFMVMFRHSQLLVQNRESLWSLFKTDCTPTVHPDHLTLTYVQYKNVALPTLTKTLPGSKIQTTITFPFKKILEKKNKTTKKNLLYKNINDQTGLLHQHHTSTYVWSTSFKACLKVDIIFYR